MYDSESVTGGWRQTMGEFFCLCLSRLHCRSVDQILQCDMGAIFVQSDTLQLHCWQSSEQQEHLNSAQWRQDGITAFTKLQSYHNMTFVQLLQAQTLHNKNVYEHLIFCQTVRIIVVSMRLWFDWSCLVFWDSPLFLMFLRMWGFAHFRKELLPVIRFFYDQGFRDFFLFVVLYVYFF